MMKLERNNLFGAFMHLRKVLAGCLVFLFIILSAGQLMAGTVYVSLSGDDSFAGTNWATALRTITNGIAKASFGDTVLISNGFYTVTSQIVLNKGITVKGFGGRDNVRVARTGAQTNRIFYLSHSDAVIEGMTISNGYFSAAAVGSRGAGIYITAGTVRDCHITKNIAYRGCGIYMVGGRVENSIISSNLQITGGSTEYGGGIAIEGVSCVVTGCTFVRNSARSWGRSYGGGGYMSAGLIVNCMFSNNYNNSHAAYSASGTMAGGLYMTGGTVRDSLFVTNTCMQGNDCANGGGAIYMSGGLVERCVFKNNIGNGGINGNPGGGGAIRAAGGTVRNCVFYGNKVTTGGHGGAIWLSGGSPVVENCTIVGNTNSAGSYEGGGIYMSAGTVRNCIVYYNPALGTAANLYVAGGSAINNCAYPLVSGAGNIDAAPDFINRLGLDFRLMVGSPCIDSGTNQAWMVSATDYANNPRIYNSIVDMGAYEFQGNGTGPLSGNFTADPLIGVTFLEPVFIAFVSGTNQAGLYYRWDLDNNGVWDFEGLGKGVVTGSYGEGKYSVKMVVSNNVGEVSERIRTDYIKVRTVSSYVKIGGGNVYPYSSWANAATSIEAAVESAVSNIWVTNGNYVTTGEIILTTAKAIRSVNGRDVTIIRRKGPAEHRIFKLTHADALVDGFTISNGALTTATSASHGGGIWMSAGTVRNCHVTKNTGYRGAGIYMTGGRVEGCVISFNNQLTGGGTEYGGGIALDGAGAVVSNCFIYRNSARSWGRSYGGGGYMSAGLIVNCVFSNNYNNSHVAYVSSGTQAGGLYMTGGTVRDSLFVTNTCYYGNDCQNGGGAIYISGGLVERCVFKNNIGNGYAGRPGGGGAIRAAGGTIRNCLFYGNKVTSAGHGGAIWLESGSPIVENCTIVANTNTAAGYTGGGIYRGAGSVINSLIYSNFVGAVHSNIYGVVDNFTFSCAPELTSGPGNITGPPKYTKRGEHIYYPSEFSPTVNAGNYQPWMVGDRDIAGGPRIAKKIVDIGCYEYTVPPGTIIVLH